MGKETQFARPELVSFIAQMQLEIQGVGVVSQLRREEPRFSSFRFQESRKNYFATTKQSSRLMVTKIMKNLLPLLFAVVVGIGCLIPAPASAYRYHGRYYPYYYGGHYYRYRYQGHYYQYQYRGHYYRHRGWVVGVTGRPGYYRYW